MNTLLKRECLTRIKNKQCLICGKELNKVNKISIHHTEFGDIEICLEHLKNKVE